MRKSTIATVTLLAATLAVFAPSARADESGIVQRAIDQAVATLGEALAVQADDTVTSVAVLPLRDDADGYATERVESAVTASPYDLFTRSDETWTTLLAEIEWGVRREDIMDAETVQKFGRIQGVQAILYGRVWDKGANMWGTRGQAKISVRLAEVETGRILWSSDAVVGEAYIHWSDAVTRFWRYPLVTVAVVIGLIVLLVILRAGFKLIRHASRPL